MYATDLPKEASGEAEVFQFDANYGVNDNYSDDSSIELA